MTGLPLTKTAIVRPERARDRARIDALLDLCFGPGRNNKTVYRFRENVDPVPELSYVVEYQGPKTDGAENEPAVSGEDVAATIRYWPVVLPDDSASLLLGPIAVDPARQSEGIGAELMTFTMNQAKAMGYANVVLVGDAPYYTRFGFRRDVMLGMTLPGPVDYERFLGLEWVAGSLSSQKGVLKKWPAGRALPHYLTRPPSSKPQR
jgi:predicted N-acetyltransferase YhbS